MTHLDDRDAPGIAVIRVLMADLGVLGKPVPQFWAAALPREKAVAAIQKKVPSSWKVELTDYRLSQGTAQRLNLKPGMVAELTSIGWQPPTE